MTDIDVDRLSVAIKNMPDDGQVAGLVGRDLRAAGMVFLLVDVFSRDGLIGRSSSAAFSENFGVNHGHDNTF
ncbi:hypothetical protein [Cypionkella sp.]|uniref:hypothetical protein n=1 Tax=Cypionkella sp. TaxID=2811411 RepID=UPI002AB96B28|nr:hypothetical protein [Cypionkella sp.]MDZ4394072.1 hypothetical protein [Cypionkella sp.]